MYAYVISYETDAMKRLYEHGLVPSAGYELSYSLRSVAAQANMTSTVPTPLTTSIPN